MQDDDWERLLYRISKGKCTPFLGAGASFGHVPLAAELSAQYADEHDYPFADRDDLARVTQYAAVKTRDRTFLKQQLVERHFQQLRLPDFRDPSEPHALLADLPLSLYLTTNYDNFMVRALEDRRLSPQLAICPWYAQGRRDQRLRTEQVFGRPDGYDPSHGKPIVYHLHGHLSEPQSLVLTEDDYLDFLVRVSSSREGDLLPAIIENAITDNSLLFIGYSLNDWTFRVLFRGLLAAVPPGQQVRHVSVQLPPGLNHLSDGETRETIQKRVQAYLGDYFNEMRIDIFWGTAKDFCTTLRSKWEEYRSR